MFVDYVELGKRIAAQRKTLGLKQYQVNELAGLSDKYLSNIETARSIPSIDVLMRICTVLNTTPNHLLMGALSLNDKSNMEQIIYEKIRTLDEDKQTFVCKFIDWIAGIDL